jgi:hypothetical protein
MPKLEIAVPHRLPQAEALNRIQALLSQVKTEFSNNIEDLAENWYGNEGTFSFKAMGFRVSGTLKVGPRGVELNGSLPLAAILFKGKIEETIRERAKTLLA